MPTLTRRALILVAILGFLYWTLDAVYLYTSFRAGEVVIPGESGPSLLDALVTDVPRHVLAGRLTFLAAMALVAVAAVALLRRGDRREMRLLRQMESAGDLFSRHDLTGRFLYASSGFTTILGVDPDSLRGKRSIPGWTVLNQADLAQSLERIGGSDQPVAVTTQLRHADGRELWLESVGRRVDNRRRAEVVVVTRDVSARHRTEAALAASEHRLRLITENMQEILWLRAGDQFHYINSAAERIFGVPHERLGGGGLHAWLPWLHDADRDRVRVAFDQAVRHHAPLDEEFRIVRADGQVRWLHARTVHVETDSSGQPMAVGGAADITARREAEDALRSSAARYRTLYDAAHVGITISEIGGTVLYANAAAAELYGAGGVNELLAHTRRHDGLSGLLHNPGQWDAFVAGLHDDARGRTSRLEDVRRLDGRDVTLRVSCGLITNPETGRQEILAILEDVTEKRRAEQELRRAGDEIAAQQAILAALIETMPLGIVAKDLDNDLRYVIWNAYMESELGLAKEDVLGRVDRELFPAEFATEMQHQDRQAASLEQVQDLGEVRLPHGDDHLDLRVVKVPVRDADGRVARVFSLVENVTQQKKLHASLQQSRRMEAVGRLAGAVAHDFNNMLQVVQGYTESMQRGLNEDNALQQEAGLVLTAVERARELVQRLLAYSRYDTLRPELVDLNGLVAQVVALGRGVLPDGVQISTRVDADLPPVHADPQQIEQALVNLVLNARDSLPGEGRIELSTSVVDLGLEFAATRPWARPGRYVRVTVRDDGCGIPTAAREHVFEPFYTTKGFGQGTGLGLATTYNICKQHQGYIDFDSELDAGTSFHIYLPLPVELTGEPATPTTVTTTAAGRGELILLVEDESMIRNLTQRTLERAGYEVLAACDGEDAMEVFMAHAVEIQLLVLDVVMPRMDGRMLYDNINELRAGIPVIFCSSYSADILASEYMLKVGGTLLAKPYRAAELLARVRSALDQRDAAIG